MLSDYRCKKCKQNTLSLELEITGGCYGHAPEDYCYCDSPDAAILITCTNEKCKDKWYGRKMPRMTDKYSIASWIEQHIIQEDLPK